MDLRAHDETSTSPLATLRDAISWASPAMRSLEGDIALACGADINVLISGEPGVGKKTIARRVQRLSRRARGPFIAVRPGRTQGATDEVSPLLLEAVPNGTVLLEHPEWLPRTVQLRILQFMEQGTIDDRGRQMDRSHYVRFLTITDSDLYGLVEADHFCDALFYRLNKIHLLVPPLRDHPEDVPVLMDYFLAMHARETVPRLSEAACEQVMAYPWPGNVAELQAAAEAMAARNLRRPIEPGDLPPLVA